MMQIGSAAFLMPEAELHLISFFEVPPLFVRHFRRPSNPIFRLRSSAHLQLPQLALYPTEVLFTYTFMLLELPPYLEQGLAIAAGEVVGPPGPLLAQCLAPYLRQVFPNLLHN